MAGGFYNHYDDPDEFWDDEPLVAGTAVRSIRSPSSVAEPPVRSADRAVPSGGIELVPPLESALVSVEVGLDCLPIGITLERGWKSAFEPSRYAGSIMEAYRHGLYVMAIRAVEGGALPPATRMSLRAATPLLLRTVTLDEFRQLYDRLFGDVPVTVHGPGRDRFGGPGLTVTGTVSKLISIEIDRGWAEQTETAFIAQDVLQCCEQIRASRPHPVVDAYLDEESISELASRIVAHERHLLRHS
ncbi:hypothetical protein [Nocardia harenae]|uniref:hypothetical protein n=1 Tax=Nocardia harenae TaxID=358707 RepID=UPI00082B7FE7|nr:hypothetical protein [Nocardia harenae]